MGRAKAVQTMRTPPVAIETVPIEAVVEPDAGVPPRAHLQWMLNRWRPEGREQRTSQLARPYDGCNMVFPYSITGYQAIMASQERRQLVSGVIQRLGFKLG